MEPSVDPRPWFWVGPGAGGSGCALFPSEEAGDQGFLRVPSCWHLGQHLHMPLRAASHPRSHSPDPGGQGAAVGQAGCWHHPSPAEAEKSCVGTSHQACSKCGPWGDALAPLPRSLQHRGTDPSPAALVGCGRSGLIPKRVGRSLAALVGLNLVALCSLSGSDG